MPSRADVLIAEPNRTVQHK